ncbi:MAG: hypothetical protein JXA19_05620 [Anaerolineales bacterium]|nr:hypothetical protein [Anaerolineales bacterium]
MNLSTDMLSKSYTYPSSGIFLLSGPRSLLRQYTYDLIVQLSLSVPVKLLIGANRYDHYGINYALARLTRNYETILAENIHLSRAETCYQMVELLKQTEADRALTLVMDLFTTFYDEKVPDEETQQLLLESLPELERLSQPNLLIVSAEPTEERPYLHEALIKIADHIKQFAPTAADPCRRFGFYY